MHLPSLKQLEYLVAMAETRHVGRAAEHCHVTPSTLSAGIRELETVLGVSLAERSRRGVVMTSVGLELADRARSLLRDAGDLVGLARAHGAPMQGSLRLGAIPTIGPFMLPAALLRLRRDYPELSLFLQEDMTASLLLRLRAGELDAALIALPYPTEGLVSRRLFSDRFLFACPAGHPLAGEGPIDDAALTDAPLMLLEEGHCLRDHALSACGLGDRRTRARSEASSLLTLVLMVDAGLGVTLLPELAVSARITEGTRLVLRDLAREATRDIGLVWREGSARSADMEQLASVLAAVDMPSS